jgi:hypothetical protein
MLDQLRFYRRQLELRRFHRMAAQAFELADYVLDHGTEWADCVPVVTIFITEADRTVQGCRSLR